MPLKCDDCKKKDKLEPKPQKPTQINVLAKKPDRRSIEAMDKVTRALELRRDYWTWDRIAAELGYSSRETAYAAARLEMNKRADTLAETIDDFRNKSLERLELVADAALRIMDNDHLIVNAGTVVVHPLTGEFIRDDGPKLSAIDRLVKINESARKLLGADAATKTDAQINVNYSVEGIVTGDMP